MPAGAHIEDKSHIRVREQLVRLRSVVVNGVVTVKALALKAKLGAPAAVRASCGQNKRKLDCDLLALNAKLE
eukprot:3632879-Rhodomonas_salina.1